jgi:uncharacterized protein (TIGR03084 family)
MDKICNDLDAQYREFDALVCDLSKKKWCAATPFFGWTIFDQVAHVAFFDRQALLAIEDPEAFKESAKSILQLLSCEGEWPPKTNPLLGPDQPDELMDLWRKTRMELLNRLEQIAPKNRIAWYGPDMSARSFASARLMEAWAHSQDVFDTLRIQRKNTARLRHVAHIGVTTFAWSFAIRSLSPPESRPRVELVGPSSEYWVWGDADAEETVTGSAEEFCLVVTQRRNIVDTSLQCRGDHVKQWLTFAQAFAGTAQNPPAPGERVIRQPRPFA